MTTATKPLKYDLPIGAKFIDTAGDCWIVTSDACQVGHGFRSRIDNTAFIADCLNDARRNRAWTKATGKLFQHDERIASIDPATVDARIAAIEAAREAADRAAQEEQEREEREWQEHEATPLHKLADRISNARGVDWSWCRAWESLGTDLLVQVEARLKEAGKL